MRLQVSWHKLLISCAHVKFIRHIMKHWAIPDNTCMNLARQFLTTPASIRPYIRSVLILHLFGHDHTFRFSHSKFQKGAMAAFVHECTSKKRLKQRFVGSQKKTRLRWTKTLHVSLKGVKRQIPHVSIVAERLSCFQKTDVRNRHGDPL